MISRVLSATLFLKVFFSCLFYVNSYFGLRFAVMALWGILLCFHSPVLYIRVSGLACGGSWASNDMMIDDTPYF
jgi:hypothetical protein